MTSDVSSVARPVQESVVLASFDSYRHAEHMLAALGHRFRTDARRGGTTAVVVTGNADGSLKLIQSRVLTASEFGYAILKISLAWMVGFLGTLSILRGARGGVHAARMRAKHVGSDEHRAHQILAEAGPNAAVALVRCTNERMRRMVATAAAHRAIRSWDGPLTEFLAALDPGSAHDWVRAALAEPPASTPSGPLRRGATTWHRPGRAD